MLKNNRGLKHSPPSETFEDWVRSEIASGRPPSERLLIEWGRRQEEGSLPLICFTLVLTQLKASESWDVLKEAALEALDDIPSDATCIWNQVSKVAQWPRPQYDETEGQVVARVLLESTMYEAHVTYPLKEEAKQARHLASLDLLKGIFERRNRVYRKVGKPLTRSPRPILGTKNPVMLLNEARVEAPIFDFRLDGLNWETRVTCLAQFRDRTFLASGPNKKEAKSLVCSKILEIL